MLTHWKEREPIYRARTARILAEHGHVPAVRGRRRRARRSTSRPSSAAARRSPPTRSEGVGQEEFDELVANLGVETKPAGRAAARRSARPAAAAPRAKHGEADGDDKDAQAAQHPPREAALMGALVWVMVGLAIWHFTIFLPDRFWGGIVGAFVGALVGRVRRSAC